MAKPRKKTTKAQRAPLDLAKSIMSDGLEALDEELQKLISGRAAKSKHDRASRIAFVTKKAADIADLARKIDAGERAGARKLNHQTVMLYLREQTPEYRSMLARELAAVDAEEQESVLG